MRARSILAVAFALWLVVGLPIDMLLHDSLGSGSLAVLVGVRLASNAYQWLVLVLLCSGGSRRDSGAGDRDATAVEEGCAARRLDGRDLRGRDDGRGERAAVERVGARHVFGVRDDARRGRRVRRVGRARAVDLAAQRVREPQPRPVPADLLAGMDLATLVRQTGPLPAALVAHLGSGAVLGTPGYMAPEVKAGAPGGVPADIYSLGAAFYYALTSRSPHDTDGAAASALATVVAALAACPPWTGHWPVDQPAGPRPRQRQRARHHRRPSRVSRIRPSCCDGSGCGPRGASAARWRARASRGPCPCAGAPRRCRGARPGSSPAR